MSAVLASAISICGVSAAVATGGAVRAKPLIPVMVSALVVVYAVIELIILPPIFTATLINEPIVAGAAMGMSVKTDGADAAAGAVMDELMRNRKMNLDGTQWEEGWITTSAIMTNNSRSSRFEICFSPYIEKQSNMTTICCNRC